MTLPSTHLICQFAESLHWERPRRLFHRLQLNGERQRLVWYVSGEVGGLWLQVNLNPHLQAAVYAPLYRMWTGWHPIILSDWNAVVLEVQRLYNVFTYQNFATLEGRRGFKLRHPSMCSLSWNVVRDRQWSQT